MSNSTSVSWCYSTFFRRFLRWTVVFSFDIVSALLIMAFMPVGLHAECIVFIIFFFCEQSHNSSYFFTIFTRSFIINPLAVTLSDSLDSLVLCSSSSASFVDKTSKRLLQFILDVSLLQPWLRKPFLPSSMSRLI